MLHLKTSRWLIFLPTCLLALMLSACGKEDKYPTGWPPLVKTKIGNGCPDLRGTYEFKEPNREHGTTFTVLSSFLGAGVKDDFYVPLRSFTVEGDAEAMLTVTFARQPKDGTTDWKGFSETQKVMSKRGVAYSCDGGWLVGMHKQELLVKQPRPASWGPQIVSLSRDMDGDLVGRTKVRQKLVISVWAETGAGIPYGFETITYWTHWTPTGSKVSTPLPRDVIAPEKLKRIESQEHELEYGVSGVQRP